MAAFDPSFLNTDLESWIHITCIVVTFQARAGIREVHFLPFNPVDKRTALTYIDSNGTWHRVSKGAPEQVTDF